jgi:hypothetical protein
VPDLSVFGEVGYISVVGDGRRAMGTDWVWLTFRRGLIAGFGRECADGCTGKPLGELKWKADHEGKSSKCDLAQ